MICSPLFLNKSANYDKQFQARSPPLKLQQLLEKSQLEQPWIGFTSGAPSRANALFTGCRKTPTDPSRKTPTNASPCLISVLSVESVSRKEGNVLIRLEHLCTPGVKCEFFNKPEVFDFQQFFHGGKVRKVTEFNLIGNFPSDFRKRLPWNGNTENIETSEISNNFRVQLKPLDLRTFVVKLE